MRSAHLNAARTRLEAVRIEEVARTAPETARIAACLEVARILERPQQVIRSRAARRRQGPDPDRIAHKTRGESHALRQTRNGWEAGTYTLNYPRKIAAPITSESR